MLLITLLVTGFCLVPPANASPGNVYFDYTLDMGYDSAIEFYFWFDAAVTKPVLPFCGYSRCQIDLQPDRTRIVISGETYEGRRVWDETFDTAPVGEEEFRFEINEGGIDAIILGVEAITTAKLSSERLTLSSSSISWDEAGTKSVEVTAPLGIGSDEIKVNWRYEWKVRLGLFASGYGTIYGEWAEMEELKGNTQYHIITYGFGFLIVVLIAIVVTPVALLIRRRRRRKPKLELKPKPELIQEPKPELEAGPEPPEMYCRSCGNPIKPTSVYCSICGTKVKE